MFASWNNLGLLRLIVTQRKSSVGENVLRIGRRGNMVFRGMNTTTSAGNDTVKMMMQEQRLHGSRSKGWSLPRKILAGFGILTSVSAGGIYYRAMTDEGTMRSLKFWSTAFPIFLHYRFAQWQTKGKSDEEADEVFNKLHDMYSPIVRELTLEMRGFYLKNAQFGASMDHFVPPQYLEWCKQMQDEVPTELVPGQAREIVEYNLGKKLEDVFSEFDEEPCGSASIGQVHRARLKETGELVAVKIQAPDIEHRFRSDIKTIKDFCKLALPQHVKPMEEIEGQFVTEFDYVGEAKNLAEIYNNVMPVFGDRVKIPKPYMELCSKEVLVMEFLEGESLLKGIKSMMQDIAKMEGKTLEEVEQEQIELMKSPEFKLKDIDEEKIKMERSKKLLKAKTTVTNFFKGIYNYSLGFVLPNFEYSRPPKLLNLPEIVELVSIVHGHEIMVDGAFNGDPHPGNILILNDGRLGLIDYGQVKRIPKEIRIAYAKLIVGLADGDKTAVVNLLRDLGFKSKYNDPEITYRLINFWNNDMSDEVTMGLNPQEFIDYCEEKDPAVDVNHDLIMPARVSVLLRGVGNAFAIHLEMAKLWKPIALKVLEEEIKN